MSGWDENARERHSQLRSGKDLSYDRVLKPIITSLLPGTGEHWHRLLDAGCGSGILSNHLAEIGWSVMGVDQSESMIDLARKEWAGVDHLVFYKADMRKLGDVCEPSSMDAVISNMSLTGQEDLAPALMQFWRALRPGGIVVIADVHPWFWRNYKKHAKPYWERSRVLENLRISLDPKPLPLATAVVYRMLEEWIREILHAGFAVEALLEPRPSSDVEARYPEPWHYPRFIVFKLRKAVA